MKQSSRIVMTALLATLVSMTAFAEGQSEEAAAEEDDLIVVELWSNRSAGGYLDAEHPISKFFADRYGIAFEAPVVPWNGGTDYLQQLRIRIAGGNLPDVFIPWGGIETELIDNDAVRPLNGMVEEYMPTYYDNVSDEIWNFVRSQSPDGDSIYFLPQVRFAPLAGMIRADWLDRVGLDIPTTIDEYVEALRAFRDQDANGNGDPNDEIPTSAREFARWMDHHFAPFGVAMVEGYPAWDIYDGEVQYSGVQPEMKAALAWVRDLYAEGLLDPEAFINTGRIWGSKIANDTVGAWYYSPTWMSGRIRTMGEAGAEDPQVAYLPVLEAEGYDGFYTTQEYQNPRFMFSATMSDEATERMLKVLEFINDPANWEWHLTGIEDYHYRMENGERVFLGSADWERDAGGYRFGLQPDLYGNPQSFKENSEYQIELARADGDTTRAEIIGMIVSMVEGYEEDDVRAIAGQFIPAGVYDGYPDIATHKMYQEYAARIIVGDWDIDRFDEFVDRWYEQGGEEVTERAQEVYQAD